MYDWKGKKVFMTGITGFVGSWLGKSLIETGVNLTALVRNSKIKKDSLIVDISKEINTIKGDICDYESIERALKKEKFDVCFHLAAILQIGKSSYLEMFKTNIEGTWNVLEACKNNGVERVAVASTFKVYGNNLSPPYKENFPLRGSDPYSVSKVCADLIAQSYYRNYGLSVGIARCSNIYGGGDLDFNGIIQETIKNLYLKKVPIIKSDGSPKREYLYVKDLIDGYLKLVENLDRKEVRGEAFNFSDGNPLSVLDLYNKIIEMLGVKIKPKIIGKATKKMEDRYLSIEKARKVLGWKPNYSLEKGLRGTIEWYREYFRKTK